MSAPYSQFTTYQFGSSATFNRLVEANYPEWFASKTEYTQDLVLAGSRDYLDIGATAFEQLAFVAVFGAASERLDMQNRVGAEATLSNSRGMTDTAVLIGVNRIDINAPGLYGLQVTFVRRPS